MLKHLRIKVLGLFIAALTLSHALAAPEFAAGGSKQCLGCHNFGSDSPVRAMLAGPHGQTGNGDTPMNQRGCEDCHGPSASHTRSPTQVAPAVSFGPRWTATIAEQDLQCLNCHQDNVAKHWQDALHMINDLTCVTCHDMHTVDDKVLHSAISQAEVCTVCHKAQKDGIHTLQEKRGDNPPCTSCHNPHDHESAAGKMLDNRSEGCRSCHDLVAMAATGAASEKASSYHKVMAHEDRTCLDCHQGIAHGPAGAIAAMVPEAVSSRSVTLFYPGKIDRDWLLSDHPGSQPLRQGHNCQQCHRNDEADMGGVLAGEFRPVSRVLDVSFSRDSSHLTIEIAWDGAQDDAGLAIMWGDGGSEAFRRGGCFAACHSNLPGRSQDRGQQTSKYLITSRAQERRIGQPAIIKGQEALAQLMTDGDFVEIWRLGLGSNPGKLETATLLADLSWRAATVVRGEAQYRDGRWRVTLHRRLGPSDGYKNFNAEGSYTLGIALHGANNPGGQHWVSLPLSLKFDDNDSDFRTE